MGKNVIAAFESAWILFKRLSIIERVFATFLMLEVVHLSIVVALGRPQLSGASILHMQEDRMGRLYKPGNQCGRSHESYHGTR